MLGGNAFTLLLGFPFQAYVARQLGAEGLGVYGLFEAVVALATGLLGLGIAQTALRFVPHHLARGENGAVFSLIRTGFLVVVVAGVCGYGLLVVAAPLIGDLWPDLAPYLDLLPVVALTLPLGLMLFYGTQTLRGFQEIRHVVVGTVFLQFLVKVALTLALFWIGLGLLGYLFAIVVAMVVAVWWLWRGVRTRLAALSTEADGAVSGTGHHAEWRRYAGVMYLNSLLSVSTSHLDRFLVGLFAGTALVGVLMVARMIQNLPAIVLQVFIVVAGPMFSAAQAVSDAKGRQRLYHLTTDWLVRLAFPLLVFLAVFGDPLLDMFGETFAEEGRVALWILLVGQTVNIACGQVGNVLNMSGQEREVLRIAFISTLLMLAGLPPLTYGMGIEGAALAVSVSVVFSNLATLYTARARIGLRWWDSRYGRWGLPALLTVAVAFGIQHWFPAPDVLGLVGIVVLLYATFHVAHLGHGLSGDDRELLDSLRERLGRPRTV